ncbi:MAG: OmpA family protein [Deltaproteobacteria bacterium]|nr:OmpA family protein [Deltaproteobacteria bacterium]
MSYPATFSWILAGAVLVGACGSGPTPPPEPPKPPPAPTSKVAAPKEESKEDAEDTKGTVEVDQRIVDACKLPTSHFDFDSAAVKADAQQILDAIAECFTTGAFKDKGMRLVGHADQRGETEYNLALGQRRAGAVGKYLARKGLPQSRMATSSRGEAEAAGTETEGWARDRKVEIFLAE